VNASGDLGVGKPLSKQASGLLAALLELFAS